MIWGASNPDLYLQYVTAHGQITSVLHFTSKDASWEANWECQGRTPENKEKQPQIPVAVWAAPISLAPHIKSVVKAGREVS